MTIIESYCFVCEPNAKYILPLQLNCWIDSHLVYITLLLCLSLRLIALASCAIQSLAIVCAIDATSPYESH